MINNLFDPPRVGIFLKDYVIYRPSIYVADVSRAQNLRILKTKNIVTDHSLIIDVDRYHIHYAKLGPTIQWRVKRRHCDNAHQQCSS